MVERLTGSDHVEGEVSIDAESCWDSKWQVGKNAHQKAGDACTCSCSSNQILSCFIQADLISWIESSWSIEPTSKRLVWSCTKFIDGHSCIETCMFFSSHNSHKSLETQIPEKPWRKAQRFCGLKRLEFCMQHNFALHDGLMLQTGLSILSWAISWSGWPRPLYLLQNGCCIGVLYTCFVFFSHVCSLLWSVRSVLAQ